MKIIEVKLAVAVPLSDEAIEDNPKAWRKYTADLIKKEGIKKFENLTTSEVFKYGKIREYDAY